MTGVQTCALPILRYTSISVCFLQGNFRAYALLSFDDYAFWLYVFGVMAFWGGLTSMDSEHEWGKLVYFLMNIGLVLGGVVIQRRVFTIFGAIGMFIYLMHLSNKIFRDSWLFPIALTLIGLGMHNMG